MHPSWSCWMNRSMVLILWHVPRRSHCSGTCQHGMHVIISSHILEEVDRISDRVVLMSNGYVVAEGQIHDVRREVKDHPMQILMRCNKPAALASKIFEQENVVEAQIHKDGGDCWSVRATPTAFISC